MNSRLLGQYSPKADVERCPPLVLLRSQEGVSLSEVEVPSWLSNRADPELAVVGWETLYAQVKVVDIPGHHFQPFHPSNVCPLLGCTGLIND